MAPATAVLIRLRWAAPAGNMALIGALGAKGLLVLAAERREAIVYALTAVLGWTAGPYGLYLAIRDESLM